MATASKTKLAAGVLDALRRKDGARRVSANGGMTDVLLSVIIARGSSVTAAKKALESIKEGIVSWNELRVTAPPEVAMMLSGIRGADAKAEAIHDVLTNIFEGTHDLNLTFLEGASAEEARDFLSGLGSLTDDMVNEVILAGRGHFTMSADADTVRIAQRLGFVGKVTNPSKAQSELEEALGGERAYQIMYLIKNLAQAACAARNPRCFECALVAMCPVGRKSKAKAR